MSADTLSAVKKIGLIAGGGALPHSVITGANEKNIPVFVAALTGFADPDDFQVSARSIGIAEIGKLIKVFKSEKCSHVVFAGNVSRPDFKTLKPDLQSIKYLPGAIKAAARGDDALLKYLVKIIEGKGFGVLAPQDICSASLVQTGYLGHVRSESTDSEDIRKAMDIAALIGGADIGQGAIVCDGLVLAVEAQEGTDAMLRRVASLDASIRGGEGNRRGVLAKRLKPGQEARVDLPTIGPNTIQLASDAGLSGIVVEAGHAFIMEREQCKILADELGIFVLGQKIDEE